MRRRALLSTAAAVSTASIAGCPTPPWGSVPERVEVRHGTETVLDEAV
ncbi:hypothetical protein [Halorubrum persicum]|nr:hypothetical protein [Halorubrum persicum]